MATFKNFVNCIIYSLNFWRYENPVNKTWIFLFGTPALIYFPTGSNTRLTLSLTLHWSPFLIVHSKHWILSQLSMQGKESELLKLIKDTIDVKETRKCIEITLKWGMIHIPQLKSNIAFLEHISLIPINLKQNVPLSLIMIPLRDWVDKIWETYHISGTPGNASFQAGKISLFLRIPTAAEEVEHEF